MLARPRVLTGASSRSVASDVSVVTDAVVGSALNPKLVLKLAVAVLTMSTAGVLYAYGSYSGDLKRQHNLSDSESSRIIGIANIGFCFAFFVGIASDIGGAKLCAVLGGILAVLGLLLIREACLGHIPDSWGLLALLFALVGQGSTFLYMASLVTYQNFPKPMHGIVIGILDCMLGFSAAIFTLIYSNCFSGNLSGFMAFCAAALAVGAAAAAAFLGVDRSDRHLDLPEDGEASLLVPKGSQITPSASPAQTPHEDEGGGGGGSGGVAKFGSLLKPDFWLLFLLFLLGQGVGLQLINNTADVAEAIRPEASDGLSSDISLATSVSGGCLRFSVGIVADLMAAKGYRVSLLLTSLYVLLVLSQLLLLVAFDTAVIPAAILTGMSFGGQWCVVPIITSALFGEASFGVNWGVLICASAAGPWVFEPYRAHVYSSHSPAVGSCVGSACYRDTWVVTLSASLVALFLSVCFDQRVRRAEAAQWVGLDGGYGIGEEEVVVGVQEARVGMRCNAILE